jgi:CspA family cold shock protein
MEKTHKGKMASDFKTNSFAFIRPDVGDKDIFMHITGLAPDVGEPHVNDRVQFEVKSNHKGLIAVNVRPA